ncbi:hypothetical protein ACFUAC_34850 [Streptomyces sp. NPDC057148]|uniref:hypothetical protein n=1 Tax=unclassified Streptomyces TaxID=2593676 RepID=UPI00362AA2F5
MAVFIGVSCVTRSGDNTPIWCAWTAVEGWDTTWSRNPGGVLRFAPAIATYGRTATSPSTPATSRRSTVVCALRYSGTGWQEKWQSLAAHLAWSAPATVSADGRDSAEQRGIDAVVLNLSNRLAHVRFTGGWSGFRDLLKAFTGRPAMTSWEPDRVDLFARGTNHQVVLGYYGNFGWSKWGDLGGGDVASCVISPAGHPRYGARPAPTDRCGPRSAAGGVDRPHRRASGHLGHLDPPGGRSPSGGQDPLSVWLWSSKTGVSSDDVDLYWQALLRGFRPGTHLPLDQQTLGWTRPKLRTDIPPCVMTWANQPDDPRPSPSVIGSKLAKVKWKDQNPSMTASA